MMDKKQTVKDEKWIKSLIKSIHKEIIAHQVLLNKLKAQQFAIMDRDVVQLFGLAETIEQSQDQALSTSDKRIEAVQSGHLVRPSYELDSIEKVIPLVRGEFAEKLQTQRELLLSLMKEIKHTNAVTRLLLDQSIQFVNQNLQMVRSELDFGGSYNANGNISQSGKISTISQLS